MLDQEIRDQLEELHDASFGWALSCCRGDRQAAEDVLQTAYLKVLAGKARFGARSTFKTWLFSVIRLTAADHRRRRAVRWSGLRRLRASSDPEPEPTGVEEGLDHGQLRAQFSELLRQLPARQREVIQLVFYHDNSLSEAAKIMGVSLGSARTHYHRGKLRLREWLKDNDGDE